MSSNELLHVEPRILKFPFECRKEISYIIRLSNKTDEYIAFKFQQEQSKWPKKYIIQPPKGVLIPLSTCNAIITLQGNLEAPPGRQDEVFIQNVILRHAAAKVSKGVSLEMLLWSAFKKGGGIVDLATLQVVYVPPSFFIFQQCLNLIPSNLLRIEPRILKLSFDLVNSMTGSIQLYNKTNEHIAFKFRQNQGTRAKKYIIHPPKGFVLPQSTCAVHVTIEQGVPPGLWCEDELVIESVIMHQAATKISENVSLDMFKESGGKVDLATLRVVYLLPPSRLSRTMANLCDNLKTAASFFSRASILTSVSQEKSSGVPKTVLPNKASSNWKAGDSKENPLKLPSSDEDDDCCEIDPITSNHVLTFVDTDDVALVAENGPVALRDFPHPRHLCGCFPFNKTSHESFCSKCFCCVCEIAAPCEHWRGIKGHCHLTEKISRRVR